MGEYSRAKGEYGETLAVQWFANMGFNFTHAPYYYGDFCVHNQSLKLCIEVKTVSRNKDNRIRATIRKDKSQHLINADFVFIQVMESGVIVDRYLIPSALLHGTKVNVNHYSRFIVQ